MSSLWALLFVFLDLFLGDNEEKEFPPCRIEPGKAAVVGDQAP